MIRMESVKLKIVRMKMMMKRKRVMMINVDDKTCTFPIAVDFVSTLQR